MVKGGSRAVVLSCLPTSTSVGGNFLKVKQSKAHSSSNPMIHQFVGVFWCLSFVLVLCALNWAVLGGLVRHVGMDERRLNINT